MNDLVYNKDTKKRPVFVITADENIPKINTILRDKYGILDREIKGITYGTEEASVEDIAEEIARVLNSFDAELEKASSIEAMEGYQGY